jgi:hypothetical protein
MSDQYVVTVGTGPDNLNPLFEWLNTNLPDPRPAPTPYRWSWTTGEMDVANACQNYHFLFLNEDDAKMFVESFNK